MVYDDKRKRARFLNEPFFYSFKENYLVILLDDIELSGFHQVTLFVPQLENI
jgi:hypothetical protein